MKLPRQLLISVALLLTLTLNVDAAPPKPTPTPNPIGDFFKRLGRSIANAGKRQPTRKAPSRTRKRTAGKAGAELPEIEETPTPTPTPAATATPLDALRATAITSGSKKRDLPYGIPVPGKPGFVMSPFAPNAGLVDVRGFASGTEVKDPYTGRSFFTP